MPDTKISDLPDAGALTGSELVPLAGGGANERTTTQAIADLGGGGAISLVATRTADNTGTTLEWTGLTGDKYLMLIEGLTPATDNADIRVQFGQGATPTWLTANYTHVYRFLAMAGGAGNGQTFTASDGGVLIANTVDNGNGGLIRGRIECVGLSKTMTHGVAFDVSRSNANIFTILTGIGHYTGDTTACTAIRLIASAGNLASGSASLYLIGD